MKLRGEIYGESNSSFNIEVLDRHDLQIILGIMYRLTKKIVLDSGLKVGLFKKKPGIGIGVVLSIDL